MVLEIEETEKFLLSIVITNIMGFLETITVIGFIINVIGFLSLLWTVIKKTKAIEDRVLKLEQMRLDYEKFMKSIEVDLEKSKHSDDTEKLKALMENVENIPKLLKTMADPRIDKMIEKYGKKKK